MTAPVDQLTQEYYTAQAKNASLVAQFIFAQWLLHVRADDIANSTGKWLRDAIAEILRGRHQSYLLAQNYITQVRRIELGPTVRPFRVPQPADPPRELLERSLAVTGPGNLAISLSKIPEPIQPPLGAPAVDIERYHLQQQSVQQQRVLAVQNAGAAAAASAYKNVTYAGREATDLAFHNDSKVEAWVRVTSDHPCGFCLMLASRGPVYRKDSFDKSDPRFNGPGDWKAHDGCGCTGRLVYRGGTDGGWTPLARQADELWKTSTKGKHGKDAVNAFRAAARKQGLADLNRW